MRIVACVVALAACGTSAPPNSVNGTVGGHSLAIEQAVWTVAPARLSNAWTGQAAFVVMSTQADLCARAGSNTMLPGETTVMLEMVDITGTSTSAPSTAGSYTVPIESYWAPKTAWLSTTTVDAGCKTTGTAAGSGTITVSSIEGDAFTGWFDVYVDLGGAGDVTGTFAPQKCPGLENALVSTEPTCQPL